MSEDAEFDYDYLMHKALRGLMRDVLNMIVELGDVPGEHHFFIEFLTGAPGVIIPDHLREDYPERMTIVLQHQFENLHVDDESVSVTLWFKGKEARLYVPFDAVTSFADPSKQFGLRFEPAEEAVQNSADAGDEKSADDAQDKSTQGKKDEGDAKKGDSADIVSLDAFRKK